MPSRLTFVLAGAAALPDGPCGPDRLQLAQQSGPRSGFALRLFAEGRQSPCELGSLPLDGGLTGPQRRTAEGFQQICDAVVPCFEPQLHWLGVYRSDDAAGDQDSGQYLCIDRFPLGDAGNETCWFYPTHDGDFLSWERNLTLLMGPGSIADPSDELLDAAYARSRLTVLWSLLADDTNLSCVGLTYGGQRIDWPLLDLRPAPVATWSRFRVDCQAERTLTVRERRIVPADSQRPDNQ